MNGKTLGWLAVAVLVIVGGYLLFSQKKGEAPPQTQTTPTIAEETTTEAETTPTEEMQEVTVNYTSDGFNPQDLTVKVGTKTTWTNKSGDKLQVSSSPHPLHTDYPALNQKAIEDGDSVSFVFDKAGTYKYHNHLNTSHQGSVVVE